MANKEMKTIQFPNSETVYEIVDNAAREALAGKQPSGDYATKTELAQGLASKQPTGDYATRTELSQGLAEKQPTGDYATTEELNAGLELKQPIGDYVTRQELDEDLAKKQPIGDYATNTALAEGLAQKQPTGDYALKSELPDVSQFITKTVNDLVYYYTKTQVDNMVSEIPKFSIKVVDALPYEQISSTTVYLLRNDGGEGNLYTEYIYVDGAWETLGTQTVDLSGYVTTEALNSAIDDFVTAEYVSTALANYATTESLNAHTGNTNNPHGVTKSQLGLGNVANERQYSSQNPPPYPVTSVAGRTGAVTLSKTDVGLSNVDNTSDTDKPVSTAQATAIAEAKQAGDNAQNAINTHAAQVNNPHGVTAEQVGAYVKPSTGIPETDLSADVQAKLNSGGGGAGNLLKGDIELQSSESFAYYSGEYNLNLKEYTNYEIKVLVADKEFLLLGKTEGKFSYDGIDVLQMVDENGESIKFDEYKYTLLIVNNVNFNGGSENLEQDTFGIELRYMTSDRSKVIVKSITEVEEVADNGYNIEQVQVTQGETVSSIIDKISAVITSKMQDNSSVLATVIFNDLDIADTVTGGIVNDRIIAYLSGTSCTYRHAANRILMVDYVRVYADTGTVDGVTDVTFVGRLAIGKVNNSNGCSFAIPGGVSFINMINYVANSNATIDIIIY